MIASRSGMRNTRGRGLPGWAQRRDAADLEKAEAEGGDGIDELAVLVEPRGQAERVGEFEPHDLDAGAGNRLSRKPGAAQSLEQLDGRERQPVRGLRIQHEQERARETVEHGAESNAGKPGCRRGDPAPRPVRAALQPSISLSPRRRHMPSTRPSIGRKRAL